jgi:hypothetical protein
MASVQQRVDNHNKWVQLCSKMFQTAEKVSKMMASEDALLAAVSEAKAHWDQHFTTQEMMDYERSFASRLDVLGPSRLVNMVGDKIAWLFPSRFPALTGADEKKAESAPTVVSGKRKVDVLLADVRVKSAERLGVSQHQLKCALTRANLITQVTDPQNLESMTVDHMVEELEQIHEDAKRLKEFIFESQRAQAEFETYLEKLSRAEQQ